MYDQKEFDLWADEYDKDVGLCDEQDSYPFAGYKKVLGRIFQIVMEKENAAVLDVGFGTGMLTAKLYENGCTIYGQDYSSRMTEIAKEKMPDALLVQGDFSEGLSPELRNRNYDFIISTYAMHHLDLKGKLSLLRDFMEHLNADGKILIGDISFETEADQEACRKKAGDEWDEEEDYFIFEDMKKYYPQLEFEKISQCGGVMILKKEDELSLYTPEKEDGWFYVKMMSDPDTMSYNARWFPPDGCIPDAEEEWNDLFENWIRNRNGRFYAYLQRREDGAFVGDVNYHYDPEKDAYDMGIVIYAPERGKGYGRQGLSLLLEQAFLTDGISCLHNDFETDRDRAYRIHKAAGFTDSGKEAGMYHLKLSREEYLSDRSETKEKKS